MMSDMDAPILMVETPCEHGFVTEHDGYSSKPLEAGDWGLDGIDPLFHCSGGTREEASVDLVIAWLREQGAGKEFEVTMVEIAQGRGDKPYRVQTPIMVPPGDYLVIPVDAALSLTGTTNSVPIRTDLVVKTPTSQEGT